MGVGRQRSTGGFSVVEAIVALAIVAGGVVALAALAVQATGIVVNARQRGVALYLAEAALTELAARGVPASSPACLLSDVPGCVEYRDGEGRVAAPGAAYAVRWYAAPVPSSPVPATILTVCAVGATERATAPRPAGVCATRVLKEPWP